MSEDSKSLAQVGEIYQEVLTGPIVIHEGRYRLYQKRDGGMRIQYRCDDKTEDDFVEIPGAMVALSKAAAEGNLSPVELVRRVMKLMGEMKQ